MGRLVRGHLAAGDFVVLLSASPQELVDALAGELGVHRAIGTRSAVVDGSYTGELDGPFCYGPEKLERIRAELGAGALRSAVGYADSASDIPLLEACRDATAVHPDRRLAAVARRRGWPVIR